MRPIPYPFSDPDRLNLDDKYAECRHAKGLTLVQPPYGRAAWLATKYEDVKLILGDPRFSRAQAVGPDEPRLLAFGQRPDTMVAMDAPEHSRLRRVVAKAFTMRRIEQLRPRVQEIVDDLLDEMERAGPPADLETALAWPLPVTAICELLGVPVEDREEFQEWTDVALSTPLAGHKIEDIAGAVASLRGYLADMVARRRVEPGDDLVSVLVQARDEEDRLTEDEMVGLGVGVLVAGHETTANQIGNFTFALLTQPELWQRLLDKPELLGQAIEEMLRHTPLFAGTSFPRVATVDVEMSDGFILRKGEAVLASMMAANRDDAVFECPEKIDFERAENQHFGFGHGVHRCLGAQLARLELELALGSLLSRFPGLRLVVPPDEVKWRKGTLQRGPAELLVAW